MVRSALIAALLLGCHPDDDVPASANAPREAEPDVPAAAAHLRKLTAAEYTHTLEDLFGELVLPTRLEPDEIDDGLLAVGATHQAISPLGVERYEDAAFLVADQVMADPALRGAIVPCDDGSCVGDFVDAFGRRAWRRPLTAEEHDRLVALAAHATDVTGDPWEGLAYALAAMLQSPHFLYRAEHHDSGTLDPFELATKLAYFLWSGPPDDALLDAAADGTLATPEGLEAEVDRLLADDKARRGVRALFDDVLQLHALLDLSKDPTVFVHYSEQLGPSAREETLLGVEANVFGGGSYLDLYTTRTTWVDRTLAAIYEVPAPVRDGFGEIELPVASGRVGLLGQASFLAGHAHAVSTSVTLRGKFVQETLLCRDIPPPPANVDTSIPEADASAPTMRERIAVHLENPACAGCHQITDPTGLAFEPFDGVGRPRSSENGVLIDPSGDLDGVPFADAVELAEVLAGMPAVPQCFAQQVMTYAGGQVPALDAEPLLYWHADGFARADHRVLDLLRDIALSDAFRTTGSPE
jgi:hypothetical protein